MTMSLVRAKVLAVLLGPAGTGLLGLYQQVTRLTATVSRFGIASAGVRQIAESEVGTIYYNDFWLRVKCDRIPGPLALVHLDCAINQGFPSDRVQASVD